LFAIFRSSHNLAGQKQKINDKAYQQTQAKPAAADDGTAEVIVWLILF
jgi:hypothetical protein